MPLTESFQNIVPAVVSNAPFGASWQNSLLIPTQAQIWSALSSASLSIGSDVAGGGAHRVLYEDVAQKLAASEKFKFDGNDLILENPTPATSLNPTQISQKLSLRGSKWRVDTAANETIEIRLLNIPSPTEYPSKNAPTFAVEWDSPNGLNRFFKYGVHPTGYLSSRLELSILDHPGMGGIIDVDYLGGFYFKDKAQNAAPMNVRQVGRDTLYGSIFFNGPYAPEIRAHFGSKILFSEGVPTWINTGNPGNSGTSYVQSDLPIGIKTTAAPAAPLQVNGNAIIGNTLLFGGGSDLSIQADDAFGSSVIQSPRAWVLRAGAGAPMLFQIGAVNAFYISAAGNFGIGTVSPARKLEVLSANTENWQLRLGGDGGANTNYDIGRDTTSGFLNISGNQTGFIGYQFNSGRLDVYHTAEQFRRGYSSTVHTRETQNSTGTREIDIIAPDPLNYWKDKGRFDDGLERQIGAAAAYAKTGGKIFDRFIDATSVSTAEETLWSDVLPANALSANGQSLQAVYAGTFAANDNEKRVWINWFGAPLAEINTTQNSGAWRITVEACRVSASTIRMIVTNFTGSGAAAHYQEITGLTLSNSQNLKLDCRTRTAAGDLTARMAFGEWLPSA